MTEYNGDYLVRLALNEKLFVSFLHFCNALDNYGCAAVDRYGNGFYPVKASNLARYRSIGFGSKLSPFYTTGEGPHCRQLLQDLGYARALSGGGNLTPESLSRAEIILKNHEVYALLKNLFSANDWSELSCVVKNVVEYYIDLSHGNNIRNISHFESDQIQTYMDFETDLFRRVTHEFENGKCDRCQKHVSRHSRSYLKHFVSCVRTVNTVCNACDTDYMQQSTLGNIVTRLRTFRNVHDARDTKVRDFATNLFEHYSVFVLFGQTGQSHNFLGVTQIDWGDNYAAYDNIVSKLVNDRFDRLVNFVCDLEDTSNLQNTIEYITLEMHNAGQTVVVSDDDFTLLLSNFVTFLLAQLPTALSAN